MTKDIQELMQKGAFPEAIAHLNDIIAEEPDSLGDILAVAICYLENGDLEKSKKALDYYHSKTDPTDESYEAEAILYLRQDDIETAECLLQRAIALNPTNGNARRNLAMIHVQNRQWKEAEEELRLAVEYDPHNYLTQIAVAQFKLMNGELQEAGEILVHIMASPFEMPPDKAAFVAHLLEELDKLT